MYLDIVQNSLSNRLERFTTEFVVHKNEPRSIIDKYESDILQINALEAAKVFNLLAMRHDSREIIKSNIDKLTNIFFKPLKRKSSNIVSGFYTNLHSDNLMLLRTVKEGRPLINNFLRSNITERTKLLPEIKKLLDVLKRHNNHFKTEKNTLFPILEKVMPQYASYFKIEQLYHNDYNQLLWETEHQLKDIKHDITLLNRLIGKLFFRIHFTIYREELVLYPLSKLFVHEKFFLHLEVYK